MAFYDVSIGIKPELAPGVRRVSLRVEAGSPEGAKKEALRAWTEQYLEADVGEACKAFRWKGNWTSCVGCGDPYWEHTNEDIGQRDPRYIPTELRNAVKGYFDE